MSACRCAGSWPTTRVDALGAQLVDRRGRAIAARDRAAVAAAARARCPTCPAPPTPIRCTSALTGDPRARRSELARDGARRHRAAQQLRMPLAHALRAGRASARRSATRARRNVAVERRVVDDHRSAGRGEVLRIRSLMVARGMRDRVRAAAGRPAAASSQTVPPGAAHAEIGGRQHRARSDRSSRARGSAPAGPSPPRRRARDRACR